MINFTSSKQKVNNKNEYFQKIKQKKKPHKLWL